LENTEVPKNAKAWIKDRPKSVWLKRIPVIWRIKSRKRKPLQFFAQKLHGF
jgi:hypothetical protein